MKIRVLVLSALLVTGLGTVCQADLVTCKIIHKKPATLAAYLANPAAADPKIAWSFAKSNTLDGTIFLFGPDAQHLTLWKQFVHPHVYQRGPTPPKRAMPIGDTYTVHLGNGGGSSGGGGHGLHTGGEEISPAPSTGIAIHSIHMNANGDVTNVSDFYAHDPYGRITIIFYIAPWTPGGSMLSKDIINHGNAPAPVAPSAGPTSVSANFAPLIPNVRVLNANVVAIYDIPCDDPESTH